jgi:hypothetical protein
MTQSRCAQVSAIEKRTAAGCWAWRGLERASRDSSLEFDFGAHNGSLLRLSVDFRDNASGRADEWGPLLASTDASRGGSRTASSDDSTVGLVRASLDNIRR